MYYYLKVRSYSTQRLRIYLAYAQHIHVGVISTTSEVLVVRAFLPPRNFSLPPPSWYPEACLARNQKRKSHDLNLRDEKVGH